MAKNVTAKLHIPHWASEVFIGGGWVASAFLVSGYTWKSVTSTWTALPDGPGGSSGSTSPLDTAVGIAAQAVPQPARAIVKAEFKKIGDFLGQLSWNPTGSTNVQQLPKSFYDTVYYTKTGNKAGARRSYALAVKSLDSNYPGQSEFVTQFMFQKLYGNTLYERFRTLTGLGPYIVTPVKTPR